MNSPTETQHHCHCCASTMTTVSYPNGLPTHLTGRTVTLNYDAQKRYWCAPCWSGHDGKRERRLDKLRVVAERGSPAEREVARLRIAEMGVTPKSEADRLREELESHREEERRRRHRFERKFRTILLAAALAISAMPMLVFSSKLAASGQFWSMFGTGCLGISVWFQFKPEEKRVTMKGAVIFALWFALLCWFSEPMTQIIVGMLEVIA